jgi:hypothetical protein
MRPRQILKNDNIPNTKHGTVVSNFGQGAVGLVVVGG